MAEQSHTTNPSSSSLPPDSAFHELRDISGELTRISAKLTGFLDEMASEAYRADKMMRQIDNLELSRKRYGARWKGINVRLTVRGYLLVEHLVSLRGLDCSYRELYDVVRGPGFLSGDGEMGLRDNVRTWITRIRKSFRAVDPDFDQIEVRPGFGYRWRDA